MTETATTVPWTLTWGDIVFHEADLAGRHLSILTLINGGDDRFELLDIQPTNGTGRLMMMLTTAVASARLEAAGTDDPDELATVVAEAIAEISSASADDILGSITYDT